MENTFFSSRRRHRIVGLSFGTHPSKIGSFSTTEIHTQSNRGINHYLAQDRTQKQPITIRALEEHFSYTRLSTIENRHQAEKSKPNTK